MKPMSRKLLLMVAGASLLGACAGIRDTRGYVADAALIDSVQAGVDNKASVEKTLGRPTFVGQFDQNEWFYVSRQTGTFAFRDPKALEQTVLKVKFDQAGNVVAVEKTGLEKIAKIDPVGDKTPTLGRKKSFFEELFGNIGTMGAPGLPGNQRGQ